MRYQLFLFPSPACHHYRLELVQNLGAVRKAGFNFPLMSPALRSRLCNGLLGFSSLIDDAVQLTCAESPAVWAQAVGDLLAEQQHTVYFAATVDAAVAHRILGL